MNKSFEIILDWISKNGELISLLSGIIFFFIRELYSLSIKKKELRYKTFYSNSINAISEFLDSFLTYKIAMRNINLGNILNEKTDILELNKTIFEPLIDMKKKNLKMYFYLDKTLYEKYDTLIQNSSRLYDELKNIIYRKDLSLPEKISKYEEAFTEFDNITEDCLTKSIKESQKVISK